MTDAAGGEPHVGDRAIENVVRSLSAHRALLASRDMGAWGTKPFENDGALDLLAAIRHGDFSFDGIAWAFEDPDYLEIDGGQIAVALGALVRITRGDPDVATSEAVPDDLGAFASLLTQERLGWIQHQLDRTFAGGDASELYELWEATDDLEEWLSVSRTSLGPASER